MDVPEARWGKVEVACPPDDSLVEIFNRLPAKPLFRFKCVSKDWCGLIADRLHCRKFPQTLEGFLAGDKVGGYGGFIDLSGRPVPLVDPSFTFLTKLPEIQKILLLDSCNGLVLFGHGRFSEDTYGSLGYIVCNPATEEWVSVPCSGYTPWDWDDSDDEDYQDDGKRADCDDYLIFDPALSPHFQLIQFWSKHEMYLDEVHTFSSVTGAWSTCLPDDISLGAGACIFNGMLHVSAYPYEPYLIPEKNMILVVGGEGRPFSTLDWSKKDRGSPVFLGQSQGHLHCLSRGTSLTMNELSIWVLEDYNTEKWVLRDNVSFSQLFGRMSGRLYSDWYVVSIHPDRGLVFFAEYWNCKMISYDMDKKEVRALCSLRGYRKRVCPYLPYFGQSAALTKKL